MSSVGWGNQPWGQFPWGEGSSTPPFVYPTPPTMLSGTTPDRGLAEDPTMDAAVPDLFQADTW